MDLHTIETVFQPTSRAQLPPFRAGDAFLAGGTALFADPQPQLRRLIDLPSLGWPGLKIEADGVHIAATCTLAALAAQAWPDDFLAAHVVPACCRALVGSFKIWNTATVGGNICLALPAAPMVCLAAALDGLCVIWTCPGETRSVPAGEFVTDVQRTVLGAGEILREIVLPLTALRRTTAIRQISLTALGRSAALLIGSRENDGFALTITASSPQPVCLRFDELPPAASLASCIDARVRNWLDDVHGAPDWRRHVTHRAAQEIRDELAQV